MSGKGTRERYDTAVPPEGTDSRPRPIIARPSTTGPVRRRPRPASTAALTQTVVVRGPEPSGEIRPLRSEVTTGPRRVQRAGGDRDRRGALELAQRAGHVLPRRARRGLHHDLFGRHPSDAAGVAGHHLRLAGDTDPPGSGEDQAAPRRPHGPDGDVGAPPLHGMQSPRSTRREPEHEHDVRAFRRVVRMAGAPAAGGPPVRQLHRSEKDSAQGAHYDRTTLSPAQGQALRARGRHLSPCRGPASGRSARRGPALPRTRRAGPARSSPAPRCRPARPPPSSRAGRPTAAPAPST